MDIQELNKKQLILLTLLITFVVSIATGIITVSLMKQMPSSVPQTINNVIQKTIERVTTIDNPKPVVNDKENQNLFLKNNNLLVSIYKKDISITEELENTKNNELGSGVIISDAGIILVDSNILTEDIFYKILLNNIEFNAEVIKKFNNGFSILKIFEKKDNIDTLQKDSTIN